MIEGSYNILKNINSKCEIYNVVCYKAHCYYYTLSYIFYAPLLVCHTVMIFANCIFQQHAFATLTEYLYVLNIAINLYTIIILVSNNTLRFDLKSEEFKKNQMRFLRLQYDVDKLFESTDLHNITKEQIYSLIKIYDDITTNMNTVPQHILLQTYHNYSDVEEDKIPILLLSYKQKKEPKSYEVEYKY